MIITILIIFFGILFLYFGANYLVKGSVAAAQKLKIPPIVIGLTIVGYTTGMPELIVSIKAALNGSPELAVGNAIGSNICNMGLILGLSALILPLQVKDRVIQKEIPIMLAITLLSVLMIADGHLSLIKGVILLFLLIVYTIWTLVAGKNDSLAITQEVIEEFHIEPTPLIWDVGKIALGFVGLFLGAKFFVDGSVSLARFLNVSEAVIGLSIVAIGTSLPELATSLAALFHGHRDLAIGNVIGSNIFNLLALLGVVAVISPFQITDISFFDYMVLLVYSIFLFPMAAWQRQLSRIDGALLFFGYIFYIGFLFVYN